MCVLAQPFRFWSVATKAAQTAISLNRLHCGYYCCCLLGCLWIFCAPAQLTKQKHKTLPPCARHTQHKTRTPSRCSAALGGGYGARTCWHRLVQIDDTQFSCMNKRGDECMNMDTTTGGHGCSTNICAHGHNKFVLPSVKPRPFRFARTVVRSVSLDRV